MTMSTSRLSLASIDACTVVDTETMLNDLLDAMLMRNTLADFPNAIQYSRYVWF